MTLDLGVINIRADWKNKKWQMSFLNSLNRFVFKTRAGQLVVLVVAVLAGVILLNPLLSGIRATDQTGGVILYSETGAYPDGTRVEATFQKVGGTGAIFISLEIISYARYPRLPANRVFVSEGRPISPHGNCDRQSLGAFHPRNYSPMPTNEFPQRSFTTASGAIGDTVCVRWALVDYSVNASEVRSPYYLKVRIPQTIESLLVTQKFVRDSRRVYSRLDLTAPHDLKFNLPLDGRLPGAIRVEYQHLAVSTRTSCNQSRFLANPRQILRPNINTVLPFTSHSLLIRPQDVGRYICYKISWSDFDDQALLHDTYFVTSKVPPITEPEEITFQPTEEVSPSELAYDIPDGFDLDEAVRVLRSLLTEEGLEDIEDTSFSSHPYGCADKNEENAAGGCYYYSENTIYIHTHRFPRIMHRDHVRKKQG